MNHPADQDLLRFYRTRSTPCPYLEGREERLIFTRLDANNSEFAHDVLAKAGFRRSHDIAYRPDCDDCKSCQPVRILAREFQPSRSMKKAVSRNRHLTRHVLEPVATEEHFNLFANYQTARHEGSSMVEMDYDEFKSMIEQTPVDTHLFEYRDEDGKLVGGALTDRLADGISMVYSYYDTGSEQRSLGTFIVLDHVAYAADADLQFAYLGYAIDGCANMAYKTQYQPIEGYGVDGWVAIPKPK
jgi:arginine-tRNA-protein transferase